MGEQKIKKGWDLYLYYWTLPILIGFILLNYFSRNFRIDTLNIDLMTSIVTFLFGFLISITFTMIITRTSALKEALSQETGRLISLYSLSKKLGNNFHDKIKDRIDNYTMKTLKDYTHYESGREENYGIYEDSSFMEIKTKSQESQADSFFYILGEFQPTRERIEYLTSTRLMKSLKFSTYLLGILLIILLFLNRGDTFTNFLFIILSTIVIFIFLIIEDYDNLKIGDYTANISNSEQIFDLIGKERYYPQRLLSRVKLENRKKYRIGFYDSLLKEEKVFEITYNSAFKMKINNLLKRFKKEEEKEEEK